MTALLEQAMAAIETSRRGTRCYCDPFAGRGGRRTGLGRTFRGHDRCSVGGNRWFLPWLPYCHEPV